MKSKRTNRAVWLVLLLGLVLAGAAAWSAWRLWPPEAASLLRSVAIVECRTYHELRSGGQTVLFFSGVDTNQCLLSASTQAAEATDTTYATAIWVNRWSLWPSCQGRLVTVVPGMADLSQCDIDTVLSHTLRQQQTLLKRLKGEQAELAYYLRVHGVQDPGYQSVAEVSAQRENSIARVQKLVTLLTRLTTDSTRTEKPEVAEKSHFIAYYRDRGDTLRHTACRCLAGNDTRRVAMLQTTNGLTPDGAVAVNILPWNHYAEGEMRAIAFSGLGEQIFADTTTRATIQPCLVDTTGRHDLPLLLATDGTPIYTKNGHFIGISNHQQIVRRRTLRQLMRKGGQQ